MDLTVDKDSISDDDSLHIADDDGLDYGLENSLVPIVEGESYTASAMTYMESGTSRPVEAGELVEWAPISVTERAPQDAVYAAILLFSVSIGTRSLIF